MHVQLVINSDKVKGAIILRCFASRIIAVLALFVMFISSASAIYVYRYEQEQSNWCWAASAQMIGHTLGRNVSQSSIVQYVKGTVANVGSGDILDASKAVDYATLRYSTVRGSALSFTAAKSELDAGEPFYISIGWTDGTGHAVVGAGYSISGNTLTVVDPAVGCGTKAFSYNSMITQCNFQSGVGTWRNTITV